MASPVQGVQKTNLIGSGRSIPVAAGPLAAQAPVNGGTFTANGATPVTVSETALTANSIVIFTLKTVGGTVGAYPAIQTITPGTGFTVACTALDTSIYNYTIIG